MVYGGEWVEEEARGHQGQKEHHLRHHHHHGQAWGRGVTFQLNVLYAIFF